MNKYLSLKIKIVSFICMIMVVYMHAYNFADTFLVPRTIITERISIGTFIEYFISNGITKIAIPIFFMMSGYLFFVTYEYSKESYLYKVKSRVISLVVPFIIWNSLSMILCLLLNKIDINTINSMNDNIRENGFLSLFFFDSPSFQFWFVKVLFLCTLISPLIYLSIKNIYSREVSFIVLFLFWFMQLDDYAGLSIEGILFFYIGSYLCIEDKKRSIIVKMNKKRIIISASLWGTLIVINTIIAEVLNRGSSTSILLIIHKISIIIGIYAFWYGMDYVIQKKKIRDILLKLSSSTFFIYCIHEPVLDLLRDSLEAFVSNSVIFKLSTYFIVPILIISISVLLNKLILIISPSIHNVICGGRD